MEKIEIVVAREEDTFDLAEIRKLIWQETYGEMVASLIESYDVEVHSRSFLEQIESKTSHLHKLIYDGKLVGYYSYTHLEKEEDDDWELRLNSLYILKAYHNLGIGSLVFRDLIEYCENNNITRFYNTCNYHNENAIRFYERKGGEIIREETDNINKIEDTIYFGFNLLD